jgi:hypothetical protein
MLESVNLDKFKKQTTITSSHKVYAEWNYNDFIMIDDYGCYTDNPYNAEYSIGQNYDSGKSNVFFGGESLQFEVTASSGATQITLGSGHGVLAGMRAISSVLPADTVVSSVTSTAVTLSNALISSASSTEFSFYSYIIEDNKDRLKYSPLISIFDRNRPDPGIVHLTANTRNPNPIIDIEKLTVANFGDATESVRDDRVYPLYKNSSYRYWNSLRKIQVNDLPTTVGVADGSGNITYAAPFAVYTDSFYANKIVVKTQKYAGYPVTFKIEVLEDDETEWTEVYSATGSLALSNGILEIYYNGTSWTTNKSYVTSFINSPSNAKYIYGVRFSVTEMSNGYIPLEVIELSPRLEADITEYVMSFDKNSTLNNVSYGIPTAGVVSTTGGLKISNVDRIFSQRNPNSILSGLLYQGTKFSFNQIVDGETIPIHTLYAVNWNEQSDFTTSIDLEDYFFFLKSMKAPDVVMANISGVESSVAILIMLDNVGITNYNFRKKSSDSTKDDFVFEYFYTSTSSTVSEILEEISNSAQYSIYVDANNVIQVATKEVFTDLVDASNTDYWLVGSESWTEADDEFNYLDGEYVSNIVSISEETVQPITEATVTYTGNGIVKNPKSIIRSRAIESYSDNDTNLLYNASLVGRDLSYGISNLWSIESSSDNPQASLICLSYISDIYGPENFDNEIPDILYNAKSTPIQGNDENDVIRQVYQNSTDSEKQYFRILLDKEFGTQFLTKNKASGYVLVDSELIKYRGLVLDVFDDKDPSNSGRNIVFNDNEYGELKASISSGSSIFCVGLLVDLNFEVQDVENALTSGSKDYIYVSSGRGQKGTEVRFHYGTTEPDILNNPFVTKLFSDTYKTGLKPKGTIVAKSIKIDDPKIYEKEEDKRVSYPGYLKLSGIKGVATKDQVPKTTKSSTDAPQLPIDNNGERFISGFWKSVKFDVERISTRLRLLAKPKSEMVNGGENTNDTVNRGIAGIAFRLKNINSGGLKGTTGYFLEIEEVGNIQKSQLENKEYNNLRLYKVIKKNGKFEPKLLGSAFVAVTAYASETLDVGQANSASDVASIASTSDLSITIEQTAKSVKYVVFWENQKVLSVKEPISSAINIASNKIGLMARSNSEAMFEYLLASSVSKNGNYPVSTIFTKGSSFMKMQEAGERGLLPPGVSSLVTSPDTKFYFEDFGRQLREVGKFNVNFSTPAVYAQLLSLKEVNPDYYVSDFSASSYGAEFWVFNTSNSNINITSQNNMPLYISGVAINRINPGQTTMSNYLQNRLGEDNERRGLVERNMSKFGKNNISVAGEYLNSLTQAENILQWVVENSTTPKNVLNADIFPNPLLELGDKIRIFYPDMQYNISNQKDKVYYVHSINYSVDGSGPKMSVSVREI